MSNKDWSRLIYIYLRASRCLLDNCIWISIAQLVVDPEWRIHKTLKMGCRELKFCAEIYNLWAIRKELE